MRCADNRLLGIAQSCTRHGKGLLHHQVNQPPWHIDGLAHRLTVGVGFHARAGQRQFLGGGLFYVGRYFQTVPDFTVDLNNQGDSIRGSRSSSQPGNAC